MTPLRLRSDRHQVRDTEQARYLRRVLRDPNLLTWYHRQHHNWVVGRWLSKSAGLVMELDIVEGEEPPAGAWASSVDNIRWQQSNEKLQALLEARENIDLQDHRDRKAMQDKADEHLDVCEWMRRRLGGEIENPAWSSM